jgi:hypothetical protein
VAGKKIGKLSKSMITRRKPRESTGFVLREKPLPRAALADSATPGRPLGLGNTLIIPRHGAQADPMPEPLPRESAKVVPLHPRPARGAEAPLEEEHEVLAAAPSPLQGEGEATNDLLVQALRTADLAAAESLFGRLACLGSVEALQVLYGTSGEDLALACRALGMDQLQFVSVYILSRKLGLGEEALAPQELARLVALFAACDLIEAQEHLKALRSKEGGSSTGPFRQG